MNKTRYQINKPSIERYKKKRQEQIKMFFKVADLYEEGKLNPQQVIDLLPKIRDYKVALGDEALKILKI